MVDIIEDVSKITTISHDVLNKLIDKGVWCICNSVYESKLTDSPLTELDIGIGTLYISNESDSIKYKFIPSSALETAVRDTIIENKNVLQLTLEKTLANKVIRTYKTIL